MTRLMLIAGIALAITGSTFVSANALPSVGKTTGADAGSKVQQATFYRWRDWDDGYRWRRRHHWRRHWW
jgi:hypothetical protein